MDRSLAGSAPFAPGEVIAGRYRVVRFVARGGMGAVYEGEDLELHERVALKALLPAIAGDAQMIARLKREIQLSRRIAHPNVCRVFDLAIHNNSVFLLTMEFLAGETLQARLQREGRMRTEAAYPILAQMATALDAAHATGVIHRDFKPSNVILAGNRTVVTDFGIARTVASASGETTATLTGGLIGTLDYMAPELLAGNPAVISSDIYALGMTAYRMLNGSLPFDSETPLAAAFRRAKDPIPTIPDLDPKWERAIRRCLDPDPAHRFATAAEFVEALEKERPRTVPIPLPSPSRLRLVTLAAVLCVAAFSGWRSWLRARNQPSREAALFYSEGTGDLHAGARYATTKALEQAVRLAPHFILAHARLAEAWGELDIPEKASHEMLLARREDPSSLSMLDRLHLDAVDLAITREFDASAAKYRQMLPEAGDQRPELYLDLGRAYEKAERFDQAKDSYRQAADGPHHAPAAWLRLAILEARASNRAKSEEAFRRAEEIYQGTSNLEGLTEVALQRGIAANRRGELDEAAVDLKRALESARLAGDAHEEINAKLQLSTNAFLADDTASAENYAREALETAQTNQMEILAIRGVLNLGNAYLGKADFAGAEKRFVEALAMARRENSGRLTAVALLSLAALHDRLKRSTESASEAQEALAYWEPNKFTRETAQCLTLLGRAQRRRGDYRAALDSFTRLLEVAERAADRFQMALAHESIGGLLFAQERFPEALAHYEKNLALSTDPEHLGYAAANCGSVLWRLGRYAEARKLFDQAATPPQKSVALRLDLALFRAEMLLSQQRFVEAATAARETRASAGQDTAVVSEANRVLGLALLAMGNLAEGRRLCESAMAAAEKSGSAAELALARIAAAGARLETGDSAGAIKLLGNMQAPVADLPDSRWQALALLARADRSRARQYAADARRILDGFSREWGDAAFQTYIARPDLQKLFRPLILLSAANN